MVTGEFQDYKQAAIEQWSADPCGPQLPGLAPGSPEYFAQLLQGRQEYAPWMLGSLGYDETAGLSVLDVGCGQGLDLVQYARAGAAATGVDLTPRHVELAQAHLDAMGLKAVVVLGDAESLPFEDESFDRVSSNGVLHHTPDIAAALREIRRVLRPAGEARIIVYNRSSLHYWFNQVVLRGLLRGELLRERSMSGVLSSGVEFSSIGARPLVRVYTPRQVRRLMRDAGFVTVQANIRQFHPADAFPYERIARRVSALRTPGVLDRVGRLAGWYVVASGRRPAD